MEASQTGAEPEIGREAGQVRFAWYSLRLLSAYRLFLGLTGTLGYLADAPPGLLGSAHPRLYLVCVLAYLAMGVVFYRGSLRRTPSLELQVYSQGYFDIALIVVLMHASGGIGSGLGMLLIINIIAVGTLVPERHALMFAATASLAILGEQVFAQTRLGHGLFDYSQAGILGATLFATALLAITVGRRSRESAALATQRQIDLENMAALNEHILQHMDAGIVVVDYAGRIKLVNESARAALRLPAAVQSRRLAELAPRLGLLLQRWLTNRNTTLDTFSEHDSPVEWQAQFTPLGDDGTLIFLEDASFINQQLQQLKLASLGRLTASIAHEIRNPLGAISHAAQLLAESPQIDPGDARLTSIVIDHCRRMNRLIEDVLQLSRGGNASPTPLQLDQYLPRFVEEFQLSERLAQDRIGIDFQAQSTEVWVDPNHFQQVLWNLCKNAVVHGQPHPDEELHIQLTVGQAEDTGHPCLDVCDNGGGIDPEIAREVFEPFYTSSSSGTGLGLFLARELCEFNGASLTYEPVDGGSCFRIVFKRAAPAAANDPEFPAANDPEAAAREAPPNSETFSP